MASSGRVPFYVALGRWAHRQLGGDPDAVEAETEAIFADAEKAIRLHDPKRADELIEIYQNVIGYRKDG